MAQISRRVFLLILGALIPSLAKPGSNAAVSKKPTPTPTPTPKRPVPTPTTKKTTPTSSSSKKSTPTPSSSAKTPTPNSTQTSNSPTPTTSISNGNSPSASPSESKNLEGVVIARSGDLQMRQTKVFFLKDTFGISTGYSLTRTSKGIVAFDTRCTHAGVPTSLRGNLLECPAHGSMFDPETGDVYRGPAIQPLKSYRTIETNGEIRIIIS